MPDDDKVVHWFIQQNDPLCGPASKSLLADPIAGVETQCVALDECVPELLSAPLPAGVAESFRMLMENVRDHALSWLDIHNNAGSAELHRRKDMLLPVLSHELRAPLTAIATCVQQLRQQAAGNSAELQTQKLISAQVRRLTRLVDDILEFSRLSAGKLQLRTETLDLAIVVQRAVDAARPLFKGRTQQCSVVLPEESIAVQGDALRLEQIMLNLLENAAKFTFPGGRVWLTCKREQQSAVIRVRDSGIGIAPDALPRIFELFTPAEQSQSHGQGGLGIGLALVRSIVELHGGSVEAKSGGPGQGSEFTVRLPIAAAPVAAPPIERSGTAANPKLRILVVDDNMDAAQSQAMLLRMIGYDAQTAGDGASAIEKALSYRPDVVLLDIGLPGMDGYQVAKILRDASELSKTVIIALTGHGLEKDREQSRESGCSHHLLKPVELRELRNLLTSIAAQSTPR